MTHRTRLTRRSISARSMYSSTFLWCANTSSLDTLAGAAGAAGAALGLGAGWAVD